MNTNENTNENTILIEETKPIEIEETKPIEIEETEPIIKKDITVLESLRENWISWLVLFYSISLISSQNIPLGMITFIIFIVLAFWDHKEAHQANNFFSSVHMYHHAHNNFFSHFIQIILELSLVGLFFIPAYHIFGTILLDPWVLIFSVLFYCSIHNINYSIFHVNKVHENHHVHLNRNYGPDICDILFGTKDELDTSPENTDHYLPNIILSTCIVLLLQYFWKNEENRKYMLFSLYSFVISSTIFLFLTSCYLWNYVNPKKTNKTK